MEWQLPAADPPFSGHLSDPSSFSETHPERPEIVFLQRILDSQRRGLGVMPYTLGLDPAAFESLYRECFPLTRPHGWNESLAQRMGALRQELLDGRRDEMEDIVRLLAPYRALPGLAGHRMAVILAAGCLGQGHLWRDLGLESRAQLRAFISTGFPEFARMNTGDMRWKKFIYRQLCELEGGYVCRAPSCDQCPTREDCFGDET